MFRRSEAADEAVLSFQSVLTAWPDDARTHYNLAIALEI